MKRWIQQKYPWTCAMIAALNAAAWWNLSGIPSQDSPDWQRWIRRCGAKYGAATRVDLLHRHLGLAAVDLIPETWAIDTAIQQGIPVEASIWIESVGLHAVLLVSGRNGKRRRCAIALGLIRDRRAENTGEPHEYVRAKISVEQLLARHCFPIGNPNRRFRALVPVPTITRRSQRRTA